MLMWFRLQPWYIFVMYRTVTIIILTLICKSSAGDCDNCINDQCDIKLGLPVCSLGCDPDWRGSSCVVHRHLLSSHNYESSYMQAFDRYTESPDLNIKAHHIDKHLLDALDQSPCSSF